MNLIELWNPKIHPIPQTARKIIRWNDAGELKVHSSTLEQAAAAKQQRQEALMVGKTKVTKKRLECLKLIVERMKDVPAEHSVLASHLTSQAPFKYMGRNKIMNDLHLLVSAGWIGGQADRNRGWWKYWGVEKSK